MTKYEENIIIPRWFLENIENTLRIQNNINLDEKGGETCQDRNIKEALNGVRKLLRGKELTGGERLEKLQPSLPSVLDEAAEEYSLDVKAKPYENLVKEAFKDGATWRGSQIPKLPSNLDEAAVQAHIKLEEEGSLSFLNIFKAGAEWMAGQFQKIEGELVDWYSTSDGKDYCCGVKTQDAFEVPEGFYIKKK